jgi:hypothetical protein
MVRPYLGSMKLLLLLCLLFVTRFAYAQGEVGAPFKGANTSLYTLLTA